MADATPLAADSPRTIPINPQRVIVDVHDGEGFVTAYGQDGIKHTFTGAALSEREAKQLAERVRSAGAIGRPDSWVSYQFEAARDHGAQTTGPRAAEEKARLLRHLSGQAFVRSEWAARQRQANRTGNGQQAADAAFAIGAWSAAFERTALRLESMGVKIDRARAAEVGAPRAEPLTHDIGHRNLGRHVELATRLSILAPHKAQGEQPTRQTQAPRANRLEQVADRMAERVQSITPRATPKPAERAAAMERTATEGRADPTPKQTVPQPVTTLRSAAYQAAKEYLTHRLGGEQRARSAEQPRSRGR